MTFNSCRDEVMNFVNKTSGRLGTQFSLNKEKFEKLDAICNSVDKFIEQFDCEYFAVSVDDITMQLTIFIVCDEMILEHGRSNDFFKLIQMLHSFSLSKKGNEGICIALNIDNIWERACG